MQLPYKRFRTEVTLDVLNMINLFSKQQGADPLLVEQRGAAADAGAEHAHADVAADRLQHRHARLADVPALQPRRPALALADPARRADPILNR